MVGSASGRVVQITNVSPTASGEQIKTLFTFLGPVEEMKLYPQLHDPANPITKMAFVKFAEASSVDTAQHLTNTVFVDRALICVPYAEDTIPDESVAMQLPANVPPHAIQPTTIPAVDPAKLDEIQRTVYVGNLDSKTVTAEKLMNFFAPCGDVSYVRLAGDETQPTRFAFVEFQTTNNVQQAILMNGMLFCDRPIKINHSNNAIVKPPGKSADAREMDEAMKRVREAQFLIAKALDPEKSKSSSSSKKRSRSRSRSRHRRRKSRDRSSRKRRSTSRSRSSRRKSRSKSRSSRRRRSRSRDTSRRSKRSRSKNKRSRSPHKKSSRSRSRDRSKRSRSRDKRSRSRHKKVSSSSKRSRSRDKRSSSRHKKSSSSKSHKRSKDDKKREKRSKRSKSNERTSSSSAKKAKKETNESAAASSADEKMDTSSAPTKEEENKSTNGNHEPAAGEEPAATAEEPAAAGGEPAGDAIAAEKSESTPRQAETAEEK